MMKQDPEEQIPEYDEIFRCSIFSEIAEVESNILKSSLWHPGLMLIMMLSRDDDDSSSEEEEDEWGDKRKRMDEESLIRRR